MERQYLLKVAVAQHTREGKQSAGQVDGRGANQIAKPTPLEGGQAPEDSQHGQGVKYVGHDRLLKRTK